MGLFQSLFLAWLHFVDALRFATHYNGGHPRFVRVAGERDRAYGYPLQDNNHDDRDGMRFSKAATAVLPLSASAVNVVVSNDDGWAVSNIRSLYSALLDGGYDTVLSAPAENQSGTGSRDAEPDAVGEDGCEYQSCPPGSPPTGNNASDPNLNYVNSFPVTSMRFGIEDLAPELFPDGGEPAIALSGPNHGTNLGGVTLISGTVGAAVEAASLGVPAVAFSAPGKAVAWNQPTPSYSDVYADLALIITNELTSGSEPYLPDRTWLNVNFKRSSADQCSRASDYKFVLTRIYPSLPFVSPADVETCDNDGKLPSERYVSLQDGCWVSISVGDLDKSDGTIEKQTAVLEKLEGILSCL